MSAIGQSVSGSGASERMRDRVHSFHYKGKITVRGPLHAQGRLYKVQEIGTLDGFHSLCQGEGLGKSRRKTRKKLGGERKNRGEWSCVPGFTYPI